MEHTVITLTKSVIVMEDQNTHIVAYTHRDFGEYVEHKRQTSKICTDA